MNLLGSRIVTSCLHGQTDTVESPIANDEHNFVRIVGRRRRRSTVVMVVMMVMMGFTRWLRDERDKQELGSLFDRFHTFKHTQLTLL